MNNRAVPKCSASALARRYPDFPSWVVGFDSFERGQRIRLKDHYTSSYRQWLFISQSDWDQLTPEQIFDLSLTMIRLEDEWDQSIRTVLEGGVLNV